MKKVLLPRGQVTVELRLRECYQAMPLEAISEDSWRYTDVGHGNNVRLVN